MTCRYVPFHQSRCHRCRDVTPRGGDARVPPRTPHFRRSEPIYESREGPWGSPGAPLGLPDQLVWFMRLTTRLRAELGCWPIAAVRVRGCGAPRRQLGCRPRPVRRTCSGSRALTESTLSCRRGEGGRFRIRYRHSWPMPRMRPIIVRLLGCWTRLSGGGPASGEARHAQVSVSRYTGLGGAPGPALAGSCGREASRCMDLATICRGSVDR
jgi:hypothetical protein